VLKLTNIVKTFHRGTTNEVRALRGVNLEIAEGSFLIVIGTNGSGKSTLLNAVAGSFRPDSGEIELAGRSITNWAEHRRAVSIGRVFQNPFSGTAPGMTIAENLALAARRGLGRGLGPNLSSRMRDEIGDRVRTLQMGLEDRLDNPIGTLSGGQRQALTLLMASWIKPELLLLDEHTAALDPKSADQVIRVTSEIVRRDRLTTMMVTHSMQQAVSLGDRIVMMHQGRVLHDLQGDEKRQASADGLLKRFDDIRRREQIEAHSDALARDVTSKDELIAIFEAVAGLDGVIDPREWDLLHGFAERWDVEPSAMPGPGEGGPVDFSTARGAVETYLATSPPVAQALEMLDVLQQIVWSDAEVSPEEDLLLDEISAMVAGYTSRSDAQGRHEVVIVPQTPEQVVEVETLLPEVRPRGERGGTVYPVGRFFSPAYAEKICERYIARGLFTARLDTPVERS
jgi:putative ABC transport system ATP-binding protein